MGYVVFYARKSDGSLAAGVHLQSGGSDIKVTNNSSPLLTDWDRDGDLDLLVGQKGASEYSSDIGIWKNNGTPSAPVFVRTGSVSVGGSSTPVEFYRAQLDFYDLDGDGKRDLLVGNANMTSTSGNVVFLRNTGSDNAPSFSSLQRIKADGKDISMNTADPSASKSDARVRVCDWNRDKVPDLLVAADHIYLYTGSGSTSTMQNSVSSEVQPVAFWTIGRDLYARSAGSGGGIEVYSLRGALIKRTPVAAQGTVHIFTLPGAGVYTIRFVGPKSSRTVTTVMF